MATFLRFGYLTWQTYDLVNNLIELFFKSDFDPRVKRVLNKASRRLERRANWTGMTFLL
jgi:hypothetical protein